MSYRAVCTQGKAAVVVVVAHFSDVLEECGVK
jgi:hypothetical protein